MIDRENIWHVTPLNDEKEHVEETIFPLRGMPFCECPCKPEHIETKNSGMVIVHNSYDGREGVEWTNEILKNAIQK